jgi:hypothetical protein
MLNPDALIPATSVILFFGAATAMAAVDEAQIHRYIEFSRSQPIRTWKGGQRAARDNENSSAF